MKQFFIATLLTLSAASISAAQHSDIEFGLDDLMNPTRVEIESDEVNADGVQILEGEFSDLFLGGVTNRFTDNPGFITPAAEGLLVNPGDSVSLRFLNAATTPGNTIGAGFVSFFDPNNSAAGLQALGSLEITNGGGESVTLDGAGTLGNDLISLAAGSDGTTLSTPPPSLNEEEEILGSGEIHSHLVFNLLNEGSTPDGALGLLAQFEVDLATSGDGIADVFSNPFFLILNNGLDDATFESQAVPAFLGSTTVAIPEPTGGVVLMMTAGAIATRRRRRTLV